ncbi:MAG: ribosome maturation factor RimP [Clostridia bacterium]|nr:ribosome maturation factor RimP [Clostridia bacterium]
MANIEQNIEKLVENNINELGYELYDVEYVKEGKDYFLRIYIDSDKGISLEDCEKVSNSITEIIDTADYIKDQYFLEVSSTGVERVLKKDKHLKENIGSKVQIKLFKPHENKKVYDGILDDFNENYIEIKIENENIQIERKNISQIKTIYDWKI